MPHLAGRPATASTPHSHGCFRRICVPATFSRMPWPSTVPDDLRRKLDAVLGYRNRPAPQGVWGAVLEWLEANEVEVPPCHSGAQTLEVTSEGK